MRREPCIASQTHQRESRPQRSLRESEQNREKRNLQALGKGHLQQARSRGFFYPENTVVYLSDGRMDTDHKEKRSE
jgi:hypothetical protein